jgi:hypothetical protein
MWSAFVNICFVYTGEDVKLLKSLLRRILIWHSESLTNLNLLVRIDNAILVKVYKNTGNVEKLFDSKTFKSCSGFSGFEIMFTEVNVTNQLQVHIYVLKLIMY